MTEVAKPDATRVFHIVNRMVLRHGSRSAMAAGLYVLVVARLALRPVELLETEVSGEEIRIRIRNAKRRPCMPVYRWISLRRFLKTFIEAASWLCIPARAGIEDGSEDSEKVRFERWHIRVAGCLARASEIAIVQRLSLYSFRHFAIA